MEDAEFGEAAVAFVVLRPGATLGEAALRDYCRPELGIKTPRMWHIFDALPKTPNGKIDKRGLRAMLAEPVP